MNSSCNSAEKVSIDDWAIKALFILKRSKDLGSLCKYYTNSNNIDDTRLSLLKHVTSSLPLGNIPSNKQLRVVYCIYQDAIKAGWSPNEN
jgi:hypothetical protein